MIIDCVKHYLPNRFNWMRRAASWQSDTMLHLMATATQGNEITCRIFPCHFSSLVFDVVDLQVFFYAAVPTFAVIFKDGVP
jgi:hypothetical protein